MKNYNELIYNALNRILPTYHEFILHSGIETPCYSYEELNNYEYVTGNTLLYNRVTYRVKVWGNDLEIMQGYAEQADSIMRELGFKRTASGNLFDYNSTKIQTILTYECLSIETIKEA